MSVFSSITIKQDAGTTILLARMLALVQNPAEFGSLILCKSNLVVYHGLLEGKVTTFNRHYIVDATLVGHLLFAQQVKLSPILTETDSSLLKKEHPLQFQFGRFFETDTLYAILLNNSGDYAKNKNHFILNFFEKAGNQWLKRNEFDSIESSGKIKTRFCNYNKDTIEDYLISEGIVGTGGNETEYLFIFDSETKSLKLIKGFEKIPSTSYNSKNGIITSIGLVAGIPNFEYFKIDNFLLIKVGGKNIRTDNTYGYLEKYRMVNGKRVVYFKTKKKLPFDLYEW